MFWFIILCRSNLCIFGIISKLSYFCCAVHLLSYYIWSFCALAKFTYFVIFCILDNRCKRLKFNQYTFNKTTARPFFSVQSGSATKPALKLRTRTRAIDAVDLDFDSRTGQIGHSVANGSPSSRRFFGVVLPRR